jgi:hypothetical protein
MLSSSFSFKSPHECDFSIADLGPDIPVDPLILDGGVAANVQTVSARSDFPGDIDHIEVAGGAGETGCFHVTCDTCRFQVPHQFDALAQYSDARSSKWPNEQYFKVTVNPNANTRFDYNLTIETLGYYPPDPTTAAQPLALGQVASGDLPCREANASYALQLPASTGFQVVNLEPGFNPSALLVTDTAGTSYGTTFVTGDAGTYFVTVPDSTGAASYSFRVDPN